jgi:hypothetical protein
MTWLTAFFLDNHGPPDIDLANIYIYWSHPQQCQSWSRGAWPRGWIWPTFSCELAKGWRPPDTVWHAICAGTLLNKQYCIDTPERSDSLQNQYFSTSYTSDVSATSSDPWGFCAVMQASSDGSIIHEIYYRCRRRPCFIDFIVKINFMNIPCNVIANVSSSYLANLLVHLHIAWRVFAHISVSSSVHKMRSVQYSWDLLT